VCVCGCDVEWVWNPGASRRKGGVVLRGDSRWVDAVLESGAETVVWHIPGDDGVVAQSKERGRDHESEPKQ
jgi:hypothetical protein